MLSIFEINIVQPKLNNFALFFVISDLVHDELIFFYLITAHDFLLKCV